MASKFFDQEAPDPDRSPFFTAELSETKNKLTMADAVAVVGVLAILVLPFTIALAVVIAR